MRSSLVLLLLLFIATSLLGQDSVPNPINETDNWKFRVGPYFWFIGMKASLERPPIPATLPEPDSKYELSVPFNEIKNSLKFALLINTEYHNNRYLGVLNATSFILEGDAITPKEILLKNSKYRLAMAFGEALVGYEIVTHRKFKVQGFIGAKVIYNKISVRTTYGIKQEFYGEREGFWVEPVAALRIKYIPTPRIECTGYVDYGPFRVGPELTNQMTMNVNFLLNKWLYVAPGYRYWLFRVRKEEAIFNGQMYGFFIRMGVQF